MALAFILLMIMPLKWQLQTFILYFQFSQLEVSIAQVQPTASNAMIDLLTRAIEQNQLRIPAWQRSIQEVKLEWQL